MNYFDLKVGETVQALVDRPLFQPSLRCSREAA
jgi:hypothetical protein